MQETTGDKTQDDLSGRISPHELMSEKVVQLMLSRLPEDRAAKFSPAIRSMQEAINRHWQELEHLIHTKVG